MSQRRRVLFVCVGNSCRSQMAEGFARAYGSDVLAPASAGLAPATAVAADTIRSMEEKNIDIRSQFPKPMEFGSSGWDLVVNMSGFPLRTPAGVPVRHWKVTDPIGQDYEVHCEIRDQIETLVMELVLELRRAEKKARA